MNRTLPTVGGCRNTYRGAAPESSSGQWRDRNEMRERERSTKLAVSNTVALNGCKQHMLNPALMLEHVWTMRLWATSTWTAACLPIAIVTMHHKPIFWDAMHCRPREGAALPMSSSWSSVTKKVFKKRNKRNDRCFSFGLFQSSRVSCKKQTKKQKRTNKQRNSKGALRWPWQVTTRCAVELAPPAGCRGATDTRAGATHWQRRAGQEDRGLLLAHDNDTNVNGATGLRGAAFQFCVSVFYSFSSIMQRVQDAEGMQKAECCNLDR